ncbi:MAG: hypothetical protein JWQ98_671 [Chlorobi bacterium]|nr:hypothetical protein [Chlorobiota bacterium]
MLRHASFQQFRAPPTSTEPPDAPLFPAAMMLDIPPSDRFHRSTARSARKSPALPEDIIIGDGITQVGNRRLGDIARPGMRVVIAFTDATRFSPDRLLMGALLSELIALGIDHDHITLLCATGLHRPMTAAERVAKLGDEIVGTMRIVDHDALDREHLTRLGEIRGLPVVVNALCAEADLLLATGVVEPHQYAGYSGGSKTIVIGCGGEATIQATHGAGMLDRPGTRLGAVDGNPFQEFVRDAGRMVGLDYVVNVLLDDDGAIIAAAAGDPDAVHDHLIAAGRGEYEIEIDRPAHIVIAGVNPAKATNLYQASRAATYLALSDGSPLLPGAPIILPAAIPEGAGDGLGERRFFEILASATSPTSLLSDLRAHGFPAGAQRAYILAQVLEGHPVIVVGAEHPDVVEACHMLAMPDLERGLALAEELARARFGIIAPRPLELLIVHNALVTLPRVGG